VDGGAARGSKKCRRCVDQRHDADRDLGRAADPDLAAALETAHKTTGLVTAIAVHAQKRSDRPIECT